MEHARKTDEGRFFKFKQAVAKDITDEKKKVADEKKKLQEKDRQMKKQQADYKKVDALAQQAISQLRGMQKRAKEEKQKRDELEEKEARAQGIDIDLIREWISANTEAMLKHEELKEYRQKQLD